MARKSDYQHFIDTEVEVWFLGGDPDVVDYDRCRDYNYMGLDRFDSGEAEMKIQQAQREQQIETEVEYPEPEQTT